LDGKVDVLVDYVVGSRNKKPKQCSKATAKDKDKKESHRASTFLPGAKFTHYVETGEAPPNECINEEEPN
jgi:hypothetical protein